MGLSDRKQKRHLERRIKLLLTDGRKALKKARNRIPAEQYLRLDTEFNDFVSQAKNRDIDKETLENSVERFENSLYSATGYRHKGIFREYTESILFAVIVALIIRAFVIEAFKIPTGSMIPTLRINDHIFVTKFIYGFKIPFTKIKFLDFRTPKHGEIVVFEYPRDDEDKGKDFIKRVIGLPGDKVRMKDNIPYINGKP
ncbi:MAG: signal peptidase I, partial [Deltaproteobacteria bacterium]|nr:signal peptidase I [Deltaproteobacteria bacterium]